MPARVVERELEDPPRARDRDRLDRDAGVVQAQLPALRLDPADQLLGVLRALLVLDPGIEVLRVLAHDHEVDVLEARADAGIALARPDLGVHVQALAQADVDRAEPAADGRGDRALEGDACFADRLEHRTGKRIAVVLSHHVGTGVLDVPVELDAGRLEHPARRLGELWTGAVAGDEDHSMRHGGALYPRYGRPRSG